MVAKNGLHWCGLFSVFNRDIYNCIEKTYRAGIPFIKKDAFIRHHGALGMQISYVLRHVPKDIRDIILRSAREQYGHKYIDWLLTRNPIKIIIRNLHHTVYKLLPHRGNL